MVKSSRAANKPGGCRGEFVDLSISRPPLITTPVVESIQKGN
jgi:hypothetical protein